MELKLRKKRREDEIVEMAHAVTDTDCWQDYEYHVYEDKVVVKNPTEVIFSGDWNAFEDFCMGDE